ncbi:MAG: alpha/beta hydrolase fold domain-containing protein [Akkermansiaceae bacterium]|nr:alpha/beta hydrolase fold domain-containing protein [Akkermansiaceae bacterium]
MKRLLSVLLALASSLAAELPLEPGAKLELVSADFGLADGPSWMDFALVVPDVKGQTVFRYQPKQDKVIPWRKNAGRISASHVNHGRLYLSDNANARIVRVEGDKMVTLHQEDQEAKPPRRPNDLTVDRHGGVYYTLTGPGEVIYIGPKGAARTVTKEAESANGLALSPDGRTLYVASYVPKKILAWDVADDGGVSNKREFAAMDDGEAKGADGMTVDRAGNVYCAGATDVWVWNPSGTLLGKIACPQRPINCTFGDNDLRTLYITGFGGLSRIRMRIGGVPPHPPAAEKDQPAREGRPSTAIPKGIAPELDVVYARFGDRRMLADIFRPTDRNGLLPAIVVVHGGGWLKGDRTKFRALAIALAKRGYVTMAIDYRLGGEAQFPAAARDCHEAVRFLRGKAAEYGIEPGRIGAVGGSAGGHLVGLLATTWDVTELHGRDAGDHSSRVQAAIVMAGPMQMLTGSVAERSRTPGSKSNSNRWIGKTVDEAPELYRLADAHEHISKSDPPLLFMCGEHDNPERNAPSRKKLEEYGIATGLKVYKGGKHGCWNRLPWFDDMVAGMDAWFREQM